MTESHWSENILFVEPDFSKKLPDLDSVQKSKRGGRRVGAGQPAKYGEKTKAVRIPLSMVNKIDLIVAIPELQELLAELESECKNSNSPRYDRLRKALSEIRNLGF